jgi:UDP-N-acetylglucosamine 2-epimerase
MKNSDFKVITIVGTRPELIKLSLVIKKLDEAFNHVLVHTGQNFDYELNEVFFQEMKIRKPDYFLNSAGSGPAATIGNVITQSDALFEKEKPDALLIYGDTNSCLVVIPAKRRKIPLFHLEAGNRCFDFRVPEEINRRIVDHISDINVVHSEHARRYLLAEGISADRIFKYGSPMNEIFATYAKQIEESNILEKCKLQKENYFVVSAHREENIDNPKNFNALLDSLNLLAEEFGKRIIVSTHPRTRLKLEAANEKYKGINSLVEFSKPLGFFDYVKLQMNARCVISDSGTLTEEAGILKFPAIMIRDAHERPEGMDRSTVLMSGLGYSSVRRALKLIETLPRNIEDIEGYDSLDFSIKVVRLISSYTEFINRIVWHKE